MTVKTSYDWAHFDLRREWPKAVDEVQVVVMSRSGAALRLKTVSAPVVASNRAGARQTTPYAPSDWRSAFGRKRF